MTKKVIIIDDSITSLNLLKTAFAKNYWDVYGAQNVKTAYEMIYDTAPDLIITDAIMPLIGGFQLVKMIREDDNISKIPVIVYSVLSENHARYYIKEELSEYFLRKDDNIDELLKLAQNATDKFPVSETYKARILSSKFENNLFSQTKEIQPPINNDTEINIQQEPQEPFDEVQTAQKFKEIYDFSYSDEKILKEAFSILYPVLKYDLFIVNIYSYEKKVQNVFFDIRDIILSPIFQNAILNKYNAKDSILFKKYAPNLKMIINEDEFYSKVELSFEYKENNIADIAFYSREKSIWDDTSKIDKIKNILENFFKARYINKNATINKKDDVSDKYFSNKFENTPFMKLENIEKQQIYIGIIDILNFLELKQNLAPEELDTMNLKISEKIISYLDKNEQVYKNDEDEYTVVIFAKDEKQANNKLNYIANIIGNIQYNSYHPEVNIGASSCTINGSFNIYEAQKMARNALENIEKQQKVVINNAGK